MKKPYFVTMPVYSSATFYLKANSEDEAKELAIERFSEMSISLCWQCGDLVDEPTVSSDITHLSAHETSEEDYQERMRKEREDSEYGDEDSEEPTP